MTEIIREYNPQTRDLAVKPGGMGGVVHDSDSIILTFRFPRQYLDDKDLYIIFAIPSPDNWYSVAGSKFIVPKEVTSAVNHNRLEYQLVMIGKVEKTYVEQSRIDTIMFSKSLCDMDNNHEVLSGMQELTHLKEVMNDHASMQGI